MDELLSQLDAHLALTIDRIQADAPDLFSSDSLPVYDVIRYHLGWLDQQFQPADQDTGKRIRPLICLLVCGANGRDPVRALGPAAAIELLHNFTLIHDDVQDRSDARRHRATIWKLWGASQAINTGDALFAISQLALLDHKISDLRISTRQFLLRNFNQTTLRIVEGQVLDLGFETRWDIGRDDYLQMIRGKTAAIIAFAAETGAVLSGVSATVARRYGRFGELLGLGFQIRDDALGIWGATSVTGKVAADDIRRRKKSFPIVLLAQRMTADEREYVRRLYEQDHVDDEGVTAVLELLDRYEIHQEVQSMVDAYHDEARDLLLELARKNDYRDQLEGLLDRLASRDS